MTLATFADGPGVFDHVRHSWPTEKMFCRPFEVECQATDCDALLRLAMIANTDSMPENDARAFLAFELLSRGWRLDGPVWCCYCPKHGRA